MYFSGIHAKANIGTGSGSKRLAASSGERERKGEERKERERERGSEEQGRARQQQQQQQQQQCNARRESTKGANGEDAELLCSTHRAYTGGNGEKCGGSEGREKART